MITYIDLCLSLNRARDAKDGLHQYRNLSQSQAPGSLEIVIKYLIDKSEEKCREAKEKSISDEVVVAVPDPDDEEELVVPDPGKKADAGAPPALQPGDDASMLLLATMAADPAQNQRDSAVLLPRVKFLWEAYRAVLDILKSNSKLERLYHLTAIRALKFCAAYKRRTEFKRLCDLLKQHLDNLKKFGGAAAMARVEEGAAKQNNKIRGWEGWTTDAIELHLQTRFTQLEIASTLHQYNEGFKVVEEIYNILQISHSRRKSAGGASTATPPPKAKLMAKYYEKLTTLFWVSENYLFHAFAWYKYYTLCREFNRGMTADEKTFQASAVLLSALCIPNLPDSSLSPGSNGSSGKNENKIATSQKDEYTRKNSARMATLLGFHTRNPTRESLLSEIRSKNVMADVPSHLREFYKLLEETSNPLVLVEQAKPLLDKLRADAASKEQPKPTDEATTPAKTDDAKLGDYVQPLISVLLLKLLHALSASYHTISLAHLKTLTSGLGVTFTQVEKAIVSAATSNHTSPLRVRIDHRARCLRFGDSARTAGAGGGASYPLETGTMRSHLTVLSRRLHSVCAVIQPQDREEQAVKRAELYREVRAAVDGEHDAMLARKDLIEKRKEEAERLTQEKLREEERKRREMLKNAQEEEERRLDREKYLREREKIDRIKKEVELTEKKALLKALGHNVEAMADKEIVTIDAQKLVRDHADKKQKAKDEAERKVKEMEKKLDYIVRATRIEEVPLVKKRYAEKVRLQKERYEAEVVEKARNARTQWERDCNEKKQLNTHSIFNFMQDFEEMAMTGRTAVHAFKMEEEDKKAEIVAEKGKLDRARGRKEAEERKVKEEAERVIQEEEERKAAVEKQAREEERRKQDEEKRLLEEERRKKENERVTLERDRQRERDSAAPAPASKDLENASGRYVPPTRKDDRGGGARGSSGRTWGESNTSGSYGGGRYEGNREERFGGGGGGGGGDRFGRNDRAGGGGDRYGGGAGGGGGGDRYGGGGGGGGDRYGGGDRGGGGGGDRYGGGDRGGGGGDRYGGGDRGGGGGDRYGGGDRGGGGDRYGGGGDRGGGGGDRYGGGDRGGSRYGGGGDRGGDRYGGGGDRGGDRQGGGGGDKGGEGAGGARGGGRWGNL